MVPNRQIGKSANWLRTVACLPICLFACLPNAYSQQQTLPLNRDLLTGREKHLQAVDANFHTGIKPFLVSELCRVAEKDTSLKLKELGIRVPEPSGPRQFRMEARPLASLEGGFDAKSLKSTNEAAGGLALEIEAGKKLSASFSALWGMNDLPAFMDSTIHRTHVMQGMGRAYGQYTGRSDYSWENYTGYISYSPSKVFNFQAGRDKNFWGDGYRSLFLSDAASPYPFFKISANVWKIKYISLMTAMKDISMAGGMKANYRDKYGSFHMLSWNATRRLNLSLFEGIIFQGTDTNRSRGFDINYANPVIFYRPVEFSLGSSDNAFIGFSFKVKVAKKQLFYGQLLLDEFLLREVKAQNGWWANKQAVQVGFRSFDLFRLKGLNYQAEFNYVRPFTYSHGSVAQNYGHFNEAIAHPAGANFMENIHILNLRIKRWLIEGKAVYILSGQNETNANWGQDIFVSYVTRELEYGNKTGQGLATKTISGEGRIVYDLLPGMRLQAYSGMTIYSKSNNLERIRTIYVYVGLRTALWNRYSDF